jgi:hypothetical protein
MKHHKPKPRTSTNRVTYAPEPDTEALIRATAVDHDDMLSIRRTLAQIAGLYSPRPGEVGTVVTVLCCK